MGTGTHNDKPELLLAKALDMLFRGIRPAVVMVGDGDGARKGCVPWSADLRQMQSAGAAFLLADRPDDVQAWSFGDPASPFAAYMRGTAGTPNHTAEGLAVELLDAYLVDGAASERYRLARARALLFLEWQARVAMWSVPGAAGAIIISEAFGPSHPQWWFNSFAAFLWFAATVGDAELLLAAQEVWRQLLALGARCLSPAGHWMTCGPRANRAGGRNDDDPGRGRHAVLDDGLQLALGADATVGAATLAKRRGKDGESFDLLSLRILAATRGNILPTPDPDGEMPRTVDTIEVGRSPGRVGVWISGDGRNNPVDPGYQEAALAIGNAEEFWVWPNAASGGRFHAYAGGQPPPGDHPARMEWASRTSTRPAGAAGPSWKNPADVVARAVAAGPVPAPAPSPPPAPGPRPIGATKEALAAAVRAIAADRPALAARLEPIALGIEALTVVA